MRYIDRTGERYGNLYVIRPVRDEKGALKWECKCDCGNIHIANLSSNHPANSCGCSRRNNERYHGLKGTRFYRIWIGMKSRCFNKSVVSYKTYGGKGITVSEEWLEFRNFKNDMYESYITHSSEFGEKNTTLERIDVKKGYSKENCKWATPKEQANNRNGTRYFVYNGKKYTVSDIAKLTNKSYSTTYHRLAKQNVSIEKLLKEIKQ